MGTPTTEELRAWARQNGFEVADRGRLSPKVVDAWRTAQVSDTAKSSATNGRPKTKIAKTAAAPVTDPIRASAVDDDIIIDLRDEVSTLRGRVEALESLVTAGATKRPGLFSRRR